MKIFKSPQEKPWIFVLFCLSTRLIWCFPLDNRFVIGSDFSSHFFKIWYISRYGVTNWNYFWYGGYPFLYYYSPFSYLLAGEMGKLLTPILAFKLISDFTFLLAVPLFYIFLKELNVRKQVRLVSTLLFSITPVYPYYLLKGAYPTYFNLPFLLLGSTLLLKYLRHKKNIFLLSSGLVFSLSLLSHYFSFAIFSSMLLVFLFFFRKEYVPGLFIALVLSCSLSIFWLLPFILGIKYSSSHFAVSLPSLISFEHFLLPQKYVYIFLLFGCMVSVFLLKEILSVKSSRPYVFTTLIFGVVALFSPYKRFLFLLPIFGNVAVSYSIISTNKLSKLFLSVIAFVFLILSLSLRPSYYEVSQTSISFLPYLREGRSICFTDEIDICHFQSVYFPQQNREVIAGAFPQSQSKAKRSYLVNLFNPTKINQTEYLALLKAGFITNIIINKNLSKHVNYFRSFGSFEKIYEDERFIIFSPKDRFSYLELNGKNIISKVEKRKDEIYIHTLCNESGTLLIKESFHPGWRIYLNGRMVKAKENKFGFILINAKRGSCIIKMVFDKYWFFGI